jgi:hypothetical protein
VPKARPVATEVAFGAPLGAVVPMSPLVIGFEGHAASWTYRTWLVALDDQQVIGAAVWACASTVISNNEVSECCSVSLPRSAREKMT